MRVGVTLQSADRLAGCEGFLDTTGQIASLSGMKEMGLFDAKNRFSELCANVSATLEPVLITRRGKPLVRVVPLEASARRSDIWSSVEEGRRKYGPLVDELELPERRPEENRKSPLS